MFCLCAEAMNMVLLFRWKPKEGITPQEVIDKYDGIIRKSFIDFDISFDNYSRTFAKIHHDTASEFYYFIWKGDFIEQVTEQLYDAKADQFLADRFVIGTCPKCGNEEAYGDQCENCGSTLNATDLINPKSTITGETPVMKSTKHWFYLRSLWKFWKEWILVGHKNDWKPNVYGQVKSWLTGILSLAQWLVTWLGIDVPVEGAEGKNYTWFDAPIDISRLQKNGRYVKEKSGTVLERSRHEAGSFYRQRQYCFHCIIFLRC
jgi:methionyl-tRNA synthetase